MQRPASPQSAARNDRSTERSCRDATLLEQRADKAIHSGVCLNWNFQMSPPRQIGFDKAEMSVAVAIDVDLHTAARPRFPRIANLRNTGINHRRRILSKDRSRVHMAERPIIETRRGQFIETDRSIVRMPCLSGNVRVKQ